MLTKTEKLDLASKINSLVVAQLMMDARAGTMDTRIWMRSFQRTSLELFDQYGIVLTNTSGYLEERKANGVRILKEVGIGTEGTLSEAA